MKKQRGSRADEGLEVSERSAVCLPRKDPEPSVLFPYFRSVQIHSARTRREKRMEKDESKSTGKGATDRGNTVGAPVLVVGV